MCEYNDLKWKDCSRKRRTGKISTYIKDRLIKKMKLDKLTPKQENKKIKSPIKIKITNFNFNSINLKKYENEENLNKKENTYKKKKEDKKNNDDSEIKFYDKFKINFLFDYFFKLYF